MGEGTRNQGVLLELAALDKTDTELALRRILQVDADTLKIERVNFWTLESEPLATRCELGYERSSMDYQSGARLLGSDYPVYFRALKEEQLIAAEDARRDPRTSQFANGYLPGHGIGAMLDVPVWVEGRLAGVLCHEHVGPPRRWELSEREFGTAIAQLVATTLEVRERRRAQEALRHVEEKSSRFESSAQSAREQVRARDELFSVAAHELYTPLSALQLAVDALGTGRVTSPADMQKALALISRQVGRMTQLVSNLLDVSRIQAQKIHLSLERTNLRQLVEDLAERFAHVLARANCALELDLEDEVIGTWDKSRLDQVITNLLSNAVKFGKGAPIVIASRLRGRTAEFSVRDRGIGIAPDKLPHIFDRFERAVPAQSYAGLGLGLFIVRAIVEAHGGTVRALSTPGEGTTMTVELPVRAPSADPSPMQS